MNAEWILSSVEGGRGGRGRIAVGRGREVGGRGREAGGEGGASCLLISGRFEFVSLNWLVPSWIYSSH